MTLHRFCDSLGWITPVPTRQALQITGTLGKHITHRQDQGKRGMGLAPEKGMDHFVILLPYNPAPGRVTEDFSRNTSLSPPGKSFLGLKQNWQKKLFMVHYKSSGFLALKTKQEGIYVN